MLSLTFALLFPRRSLIGQHAVVEKHLDVYDPVLYIMLFVPYMSRNNVVLQAVLRTSTGTPRVSIIPASSTEQHTALSTKTFTRYVKVAYKIKQIMFCSQFIVYW